MLVDYTIQARLPKSRTVVNKLADICAFPLPIAMSGSV